MKPSHNSILESLQESIIDIGVHIEDHCSSWEESHHSQWYHLCSSTTQYISYLEHSKWGFLMKASIKSSLESLQEWISILIEEHCSSWEESHYSQWYRLCSWATQYIIFGVLKMRFLDETFIQVKFGEPARVNHWHWYPHRNTLFIMRGVSLLSIIPSM